jgi:hypothetical protein
MKVERAEVLLKTFIDTVCDYIELDMVEYMLERSGFTDDEIDEVLEFEEDERDDDTVELKGSAR